jgi:hypothetical protein
MARPRKEASVTGRHVDRVRQLVLKYNLPSFCSPEGSLAPVRLILEGLTGTGKTQTLAAMKRLGLLPPVVVSEEETLGEVMDEIATDPTDVRHLLRRLTAVHAQLPTTPSPGFLLERFHPSYFALLPVWSYYDALDAELATMDVSTALLTIDPRELRDRSLCRREHDGADWQGFAARFGSEDKALDALRASQDRRFDALARSRLKSRIIDTGGMEWERYARSLAEG